jgi:hypothetical protein
MFPELFYKTCYGTKNPSEEFRKRHTFQPASISGYQRLRVNGMEYPGITPTSNRTVSGTFITGLTAENLQKMDKYEGGQFDRKQVTITLLKRQGNGNTTNNGSKVGDVWVFKFPHELETEEW